MKRRKRWKDLTRDEKFTLATKVAGGLLLVGILGEVVVINYLKNENNRLRESQTILQNSNNALKLANDIVSGNLPEELNNKMEQFVDTMVDSFYSRNVDKLGLGEKEAKFYAFEDLDDYLLKNVKNYKSLSDDDALDLQEQIMKMLDKKGFEMID